MSRKKVSVDTKEFINKLKGALHDEPWPGGCFSCLSSNAPRMALVNFLPILHDCLEDAGVTIEVFCEADVRKMFVASRGRLRITNFQRCLEMHHIEDIIDNLAKGQSV